MTRIDYEAYARDLGNWYNNEEFYEVRTAEDLCQIFDSCKFTTNQFIQAFSIIRRKFNSSEVLSLSQHARIQEIESGEDAFDVLDFISKLLNNKAVNDAAKFIRNHNVQKGKNIKYLVQIPPWDKDFFLKTYDILLKACEEGDTDTFKFAARYRYIYARYGTDYSSETLIMWAYKQGDMELFKQLSIFSNIYAHNSLEAIKCLYTQLNGDVDTRYGIKNSPLHYAALNDDVEVAKFLISLKKIDINAKDIFQATAIHYAALNRNVEVIKYLCSLPGIDINAKDKTQKTPLHYAVLINNIEVVKYLCSLPNIDINATDEQEQSALYIAVENDYIEIIRSLSERGSNK